MRKDWLPNQHGAWAFLVAPVVVGSILGGLRWMHLLLLLAWLAAYCANFYMSLTLKTGRWSKYRRQLVAYGTTALAGGAVLVSADPHLLRIAIVAMPAFLLNLYFVRARNERSWINDLAGIALAFAVGFGAFRLGAVNPDPIRVEHAWRAIAVVCFYFVGTVFYVKTMIRERGVALWLRVSIGFHAALFALLVAMQWWLLSIIAFAAVVRAIVVPRLGWMPKRVGLLEVVFTVAFSVGVLV